jgi:two-component system sensor histidine kinase VicK
MNNVSNRWNNINKLSLLYNFSLLINSLQSGLKSVCDCRHEADKVRIYEVISNLLKNAIKFTKEGPVTIAGTEKMDYNKEEVVVSIKDTGTGIDPEILPRLFTKFATKSITGTGLGLFISKNIVEAHSGKIWAENNSDGKRGATFYFSLPLSK